MNTPSIVFIGESPPAGSSPSFVPFDCGSGTRLAATLGLRGRHVVTTRLLPVNLFDLPRGVKGAPDWDHVEAVHAADRLMAKYPSGSVAVALGERVLEACSRWGSRRVLALPHPSGASTALNTGAQRRDARRVVLPTLVALGDLRLADFDLARPEVAVDLATALFPDAPARALAALEHVRSRKDDAPYSTLRLAAVRALLPDWKVSQRAVADAERLRRSSPWDPDEADDGTGRPKSGHVIGADRLYRHWCLSEHDACLRACAELRDMLADAETEQRLPAQHVKDETGSPAGVT